MANVKVFIQLLTSIQPITLHYAGQVRNVELLMQILQFLTIHITL